LNRDSRIPWEAVAQKKPLPRLDISGKEIIKGHPGILFQKILHYTLLESLSPLLPMALHHGCPDARLPEGNGEEHLRIRAATVMGKAEMGESQARDGLKRSPVIPVAESGRRGDADIQTRLERKMNAGGFPDEEDIIKEEAHMMGRVARRLDTRQGMVVPFNPDLRVQVPLGHGFGRTIEFRDVSQHPERGLPQLFRFCEMGNRLRVADHPGVGIMPEEKARSPGMIEVDVSEKNDIEASDVLLFQGLQ